MKAGPVKLKGFMVRPFNLAFGRVHRRSNRKRLRNPDPTILSNNCVAGIILHDLDLRFNTPTINLTIDAHQFLTYVRNLKEYSTCELVPDESSDRPYPVGLLKGGPEDIQILFFHYKTFAEAKAKWEERSKRINYDNIFIVMELGKAASYEFLREFEKIPYEHKVAITDRPYPEISSAFCIPIYDQFFPGKLFTYKGISGKRYLDQFDYVSFLNRDRRS